MLIGDFHMHSTYSDGRLSIRQLIDVFGSSGMDVIAITDHLCEETTFLGKTVAYLGKSLTRETFPRYMNELRSEAERAWNVYRLLVLPGFEITKNSLKNHRSAHIVAVGVDRWISPDLPVEQIIEEIRRAGGLAVAAHPTSPYPGRHQSQFLWDRRHELSFDAWEMCADAKLTLPEVVSTSLPKIASSDLHRPHQISSWKTEIDASREQEAIFEAIRNQDIQIRYYEAPAAERAAEKWVLAPQSI